VFLSNCLDSLTVAVFPQCAYPKSLLGGIALQVLW